MIKGVIFDLDNTLEEWLVFEDEVEEDFAQRLANKYDIDPKRFKTIFDQIKVSYLHSRSLPQDYGRDVWFSETLAHFDIFDEDIDALVTQYWDELVAKVRLFPHAKQTLKELQGDYKLALLSDSDGDLFWKQKRIKRLEIGSLFDAIVTSDDIGANKPHPRCFIETAKRLNLHPEQCVMVGDHPEVDLITAKELGMLTVWTREGLDAKHKARTYEYADVVIDDIYEVVDVVKTASKK